MEEEDSTNQSIFSNLENVVSDGFCHVCFVEDSLEQNPIVFCDNCNVAVHKDCYYIDEIPEGNWYCDLCKYLMENPKIEKPKCCICNKKPEQDAFKRTQDGHWCHVICAITLVGSFYISNVECPKTDISHQIAKERFELQCDICDDPPKGACLQCFNERCTKSVHPICAFKSSRYEKIPDELSDGSIRWRIYCPLHRTDRTKINDNQSSSETILPSLHIDLPKESTISNYNSSIESTPTETVNTPKIPVITSGTNSQSNELLLTQTTLSSEDIDLLLKRSHGRPSKYGQPPNISMNDRSFISQLIRGSYRLFYKEQNLIIPPPNDIVERSTYEYMIQNKWLEIPDTKKKEYEEKFIESLKEKKNSNMGTRTRQNAGIRRNITDYYTFNNSGIGRERRGATSSSSTSSSTTTTNTAGGGNGDRRNESGKNVLNNNNGGENIPNITVTCERFQNEYVNPYFDTCHLDKLKHFVIPENDPLFIIPPLSSCFTVNSISQYELQNPTSKYQSKSSTNAFSRIIKSKELPSSQLMLNSSVANSIQLNIPSPNNNSQQQPTQFQEDNKSTIPINNNNNNSNNTDIPLFSNNNNNSNNTDIEPNDNVIKVLFTGLHTISCNYRIRHTYAPNHLFKESLSNPRPSLDLSIKSDWKPCDLITGISSDQLMSLMIYEYQKNKNVTGIVDQPVIHPSEWLKPLKPFNWIKIDDVKDMDCNNEEELSTEIENELKNKIQSFKKLNFSLHEKFKVLHHLADSSRKKEIELNLYNATDQYYLQYSCWKSLFNSICIGVKDKTLDPEFDELPASWTIPVDGRPSKEECAERNPPEELCSICFQSSVTEWNPLVICDGCDISFHKNCYGISNIPEGSFYCDVCNEIFSKRARSKFMTNFVTNPEAAIESAKNKKYPHCVLCGYNNGGAMKKSNKGEWVHIVCALWIPDVYINDKIFISNIEISQNLMNFINKNNNQYNSNIPAELSNSISNNYIIYYPDSTSHVSYISLKERSQCVKSNFQSSFVVFAKCSICNIAKGICYKCACGSCNKYFHILCAWFNGNYFNVKKGEKSIIESENIVYAGGGRGHTFEIYCINHSPNCTTPEDIKKRQDIQKKKREIIGKHPQQFYDTINKFYVSKAKSKTPQQQQKIYENDYYYTSAFNYSYHSSYNTPPVRKFNLRQDNYIEEPKSLPTNIYKSRHSANNNNNNNNKQNNKEIIPQNIPPSPPFIPVQGDVYPEKTCMCCLYRNNDELVECKKCHILVHPECYGIPKQYRIKKKILKQKITENVMMEENKEKATEKSSLEIDNNNNNNNNEIRKQLFVSPEKNDENESNQNQTSSIHPTTVIDILSSTNQQPPTETTPTANPSSIITTPNKQNEKEEYTTYTEEITPVDKNNWLCDVCRNDVIDAICVLCPRLGGAMRCVKDDIYMHVYCSHSNKHVKLISNEIDGGYFIDIRSLQKKWLGSIYCPLCKMKYGRPISCFYEKTCPVKYHALCGYFHKKAVVNIIDYNKAWTLQLYCNDHIPKDVLFNKVQNRYIVVSKKEEYIPLLEKFNVLTRGNEKVEESFKEIERMKNDLNNVINRGENRINHLMKMYKEKMKYANEIYKEIKENNRIRLSNISCIADYILNHEEIPERIHKSTRDWLFENGSEELINSIKKEDLKERKRQLKKEKQKKERNRRKSTQSSSTTTTTTTTISSSKERRRKSEPISLKPTRIQPSRLANKRDNNNNNNEEKNQNQNRRNSINSRNTRSNGNNERSRSRSSRNRNRYRNRRRRSNIIEEDEDEENERVVDDDDEDDDSLDESIIKSSRRNKSKDKNDDGEEEEDDQDEEEGEEEEEEEKKESRNNNNKKRRKSLQEARLREKEEEEKLRLEKSKKERERKAELRKKREKERLLREMKEYQLSYLLGDDEDEEEDDDDENEDDEDFVMHINRKKKRRRTTGNIDDDKDIKRIKTEENKNIEEEEDSEDSVIVENNKRTTKKSNKSKNTKEEEDDDDNDEEENVNNSSKNNKLKSKHTSSTITTPKRTNSSTSTTREKCKSESKYDRNLRSKTPLRIKSEKLRKFSFETEREIEYIRNHERNDKFNCKNLIKIPSFKNKKYVKDECGEIEKIFDEMSEDLKDGTLCEILNDEVIVEIERLRNEIENNSSTTPSSVTPSTTNSIKSKKKNESSVDENE